ncbi:hypothetical protein D9M68_335850 [compost metagenome]
MQAQLALAQLGALDQQAVAGPARAQLQVAERLRAVEAELADAHFAQFDGQRQAQRRQAERRVVFLRSRREEQRHALGLDALQTQGQAQQAGRRPGEARCEQLDLLFALPPGQALGLPGTAQAAGETLHAHPRKTAQQPATAGAGAEQQRDAQAQHQQHGQQAEGDTLQLHSSGPMEKCRR